jgi:hypothetical protein
MRSISSYKDKHGLLVTREQDGGDSCFFTCHYYYALYLLNKHTNLDLEKVLKHLDVDGKPGKYIRHPGPDWYADPDRMSRDQLTPLIIVLGAYGLKTRLRHLFFRWLKRGMFTTNVRRNGSTKENHNLVYNTKGDRRNYHWKLPDFAPFFGSLFIRSAGYKWAYPLLYLYDIELLISAIKNLKWASKSGDDHNYLSRLLQAREIMPTFISRIACQVYRRRQRIKTPLDADYIPINAIQSALLYYASRGNYKYPALDVVMRPITEKL